MHYLMQGQIALHRLTAQYLSSVRGDVVSEVRDQTAGRKLGISLSLSLELRLIVGMKCLDNEPN